MHWIDWLVVTVPLLTCTAIALYTRRYVRSVADFVAGGRCAGRYMLCVVNSEYRASPVVYVSQFQIFFIAGFTMDWWNRITLPISLFLATIGWVTYRYRETRALTLGQFFEMRYSRRFRFFAGSLSFLAGLLGSGIGPIIAAGFLVHYLHLPSHVHILGASVSTALLLMGVFLTLAALMATNGGLVTILITDCIEGLFSHIFYVFIALVLLIMYLNWDTTAAALMNTPPGKSNVNPFDIKDNPTFNIWYVYIGLWLNTYGYMAWGGGGGNSAPLSAHESRMASILGSWRALLAAGLLYLMMICATQFMRSAEGAAFVERALSGVTDPATRNQMRVPIIFAHLLPIGIKGAFLATLVMGIIASDSASLNVWSSIFIQDVIVPRRKIPLTTKQHLGLLRLAIIGVALFVFSFGAIFPQTEYVKVWGQVTMVFFTGGAGAAIIGGLYWGRGTTAGAWSGMLTGSTLSVLGIGLRIYFQKVLGHEFPITGVWVSLIASIAALLVYVIVSLLTCRQPHNMDRLLHRGNYAVASDHAKPVAQNPAHRVPWFWRMAGIDVEYTRSDRWVTLSMFWWSWGWVGVFVGGSLIYLFHPWSNMAWTIFWVVMSVHVPLSIGVAVTIWLTTGACFDIKRFFRALRAQKVDAADDGTVHREDKEKELPQPVLAK